MRVKNCQFLAPCSFFFSARLIVTLDLVQHSGSMSEKHSIQTPFNIIPQLIGPYSWSKTSRATLADKMDLYFQDFSFVPLFLQVRAVNVFARELLLTFLLPGKLSQERASSSRPNQRHTRSGHEATGFVQQSSRLDIGWRSY